MKERLDVLLTEKNFFDSRARAKAMIMAGKILVNGQKVDKAGTRRLEFSARKCLL